MQENGVTAALKVFRDAMTRQQQLQGIKAGQADIIEKTMPQETQATAGATRVESLGYGGATQSDMDQLSSRNQLTSADSQVGKFYNYIPFKYQDEGGTQYGLIQTPSWNKKAVTKVFTDNGYEFSTPEESMKFLKSLTDNFSPSRLDNYSYKEFSQFEDKQTAPLEWMQKMRERYVKNNPDSYYVKNALKAINRYKVTGRL